MHSTKWMRNGWENKKRAQDAFVAHLGTLDELLQESVNLADHFVKFVNTQNEKEEELTRSSGVGSNGLMMGVTGVVERREPSRHRHIGGVDLSDRVRMKRRWMTIMRTWRAIIWRRRMICIMMMITMMGLFLIRCRF